MSITETSSNNSSRSSSPDSNLRINIPKMKKAPPPPMPPSNTLIISPLRNSSDFFYDPQFQKMLEAYFRSQISSIVYWNFSPYFQTLNIVFDNTPDAQHIQKILNGQDIAEHLEGIPPCHVVISFGIPTQSSDAQYLALPKLEKQFKLSPPPSPPAGYVQGIEDAPNKIAHAEDYEVHSQELHTALKRAMTLQDEPQYEENETQTKTRGRSQSLAVVYHPELYGSNPELPSISVEDTDFDEPVLDTEALILANAHTARPPVELMEH